jgi:hypothetical protein
MHLELSYMEVVAGRDELKHNSPPQGVGPQPQPLESSVGVCGREPEQSIPPPRREPRGTASRAV